MIQKAACPPVAKVESPPQGTCNPKTQTGCDRSLNEYCVEKGGRTQCVCPAGFSRHPMTRVCGGSLCNPQLITSCVYPEECLVTPYMNFRCACPDGYSRDHRTGFCVSVKEVHIFQQQDADCHNGGQKCGQNEYCASDRSGHWFCECKSGFERSPSTGQCSYPVKNECLTGENDCDRSARCIDTDDGYLCACPSGFIDRSPDPVTKPGRLCVAEQNECLDGTHK
ncbi:unnamed protein product [Cylicostephanus goldi]|uniref:EGF-like domain-containing protein n=1 Tax=Cylicostephanus goldi TaxID=71465 RepID=A0A3P7QIC2_CYLGO|nr:unnamed protein product [Cylicostephanus goldi]